MTLNLDELERLLGSANPGPWTVSRGGTTNRPTQWRLDSRSPTMVVEVHQGARDKDTAHLIAAAVNALPHLLARAREADQLRAALDAAIARAEGAERERRLALEACDDSERVRHEMLDDATEALLIARKERDAALKDADFWSRSVDFYKEKADALQYENDALVAAGKSVIARAERAEAELAKLRAVEEVARRIHADTNACLTLRDLDDLGAALAAVPNASAGDGEGAADGK